MLTIKTRIPLYVKNPLTLMDILILPIKSNLDFQIQEKKEDISICLDMLMKTPTN